MGSSKLFGSAAPALPHLVRPGGLKGEVLKMRQDVDHTFTQLEVGGGYVVTDVFVDPVAADPDGFVEALASAAVARTLEDADLDGAQMGTELVPPRRISVTSSTSADITAVEILITGRVRDASGELVEQTVAVTTTDGGNATDLGDGVLSIVDMVVIPAMDGAGGSLQIGFSAAIGLSQPIATRGGFTGPLQEVFNGSLVTNGAFASAADVGPHGAYTPNTAPNGAHDYALTYVVG